MDRAYPEQINDITQNIFVEQLHFLLIYSEKLQFQCEIHNDGCERFAHIDLLIYIWIYFCIRWILYLYWMNDVCIAWEHRERERERTKNRIIEMDMRRKSTGTDCKLNAI